MLWLRGEPVTVGDADVVIEPGDTTCALCMPAWPGWRCGRGMSRDPHRLARLPIVTFATSYGPFDCLLERGSRDWEQLREAAGPVSVADVMFLSQARAT